MIDLTLAHLFPWLVASTDRHMPKQPRFENLYPHPPHRVRDVLRWKLGLGPKESERPDPDRANKHTPQLQEPDWSRIEHPHPDQLQITWIGHATFLIQLEGTSWLTDPVFSPSCGPLPLPHCRRRILAALPWERLPRIDGVLISHAHYDHMDEPTLQRLDRSARLFIPTGLAGWFHRKGFSNVNELGWWDSRELPNGWRMHACPVQHFAARSPGDWNRTLWCGWLLETPNWKWFFAGDTGYCPVFKEIGRRFPHLDAAILPMGAYAPRWLMQAMHADPFDAARMHLDLQTRYSVPGHWGTFPLTDESPGEPALLLKEAREHYGIDPTAFPVLQPGQTLVIARRGPIPS